MICIYCVVHTEYGEDMSRHIGTLIRERRTAKGLTADNLGRMVGRDRQMVYRWENGQSVPSPEAYAELVAAGILTREEAACFLLGPEAA